MAEYLDLNTWARRGVFEFFRDFDKPYFNISARIDITNFLTTLREYPGVNVSMAYHYFALRVANEVVPFRYRLKDGKVLVYDVIHGGTTVLMPNEAFAFAYFDYCDDFYKFVGEAERSVNATRSGSGAFTPKGPREDDMIHFTTLPWVSFTSFSHARNWGQEDSVPKIAFGKFSIESEHTYLPISVEVHHALMDGLHVGRYITKLEEMMSAPLEYIKATTSN